MRICLQHPCVLAQRQFQPPPWRRPCPLAADNKLNPPRRRAQGPLFAFDGATEQWKKRHFKVTNGVLSYSQVRSTMARQNEPSHGTPPFLTASNFLSSLQMYSETGLDQTETQTIQLFSSAHLEVVEWPMFGRKCLKLTPRQGDMPYLLSASSEREQEGWVRAFEDQGVSILRKEADLFRELSGISLW